MVKYDKMVVKKVLKKERSMLLCSQTLLLEERKKQILEVLGPPITYYQRTNPDDKDTGPDTKKTFRRRTRLGLDSYQCIYYGGHLRV